MIKRVTLVIMLACGFASVGFAQNANTSAPVARPRATPSPTPSASPKAKPAPTAPAAAKTPATKPAPAAGNKQVRTNAKDPASQSVVEVFEALLDGIRAANVKVVTGIYWNSPQLVLFNRNGTVTRTWEQMRKNREASYPDLKDVVLDVRDVRVQIMGRDGALVTCLWTQSQTFRGTPESASGRMTLVFRRLGNAWKAIHLHTSSDNPEPGPLLPSEQTSEPSPTPTPKP